MKPLKWYDHISVNLFWLGLNIRNNSVSSVLMPYMVAILAAPEIRNTALGGMRIAGLVSDGQFVLAVIVTGAGLLIVMLLTMLLVKEKPLEHKPDLPLGPPMLLSLIHI